MRLTVRSGMAEVILCILLLLLTPSQALTDQNGISELRLEAPNPGALELYELVPPGLPSHSPLVVALHGCGQTAETHAVAAGWITMAREHELALLLPQQTRDNNPATCFNWFDPEHTGREGNEALSIIAAVDQMIETHDLDPERVFIAGLSAGGAMASALMAAYPERFAGGGVFAGVAVGCAETMAGAFSCMQGGDDKPPEELGERILDLTDHQGSWPRISIWQGDTDNIVRPRNQEALMRQWTHIHGLEQKATSVQRIGPAERRRFEKDGRTPVEVWSVQDMGHGMPISTQRCGHEIEHMPDVGLCAARHLLAFWDLAAPPVRDETSTETDQWQCVESVNTNYRHVETGRAESRFGMVYAKGSGDRLGLYISPWKTRLAETTSEYWEYGTCPE